VGLVAGVEPVGAVCGLPCRAHVGSPVGSDGAASGWLLVHFSGLVVDVGVSSCCRAAWSRFLVRHGLGLRSAVAVSLCGLWRWVLAHSWRFHMLGRWYFPCYVAGGVVLCCVLGSAQYSLASVSVVCCHCNLFVQCVLPRRSAALACCLFGVISDCMGLGCGIVVYV